MNITIIMFTVFIRYTLFLLFILISCYSQSQDINWMSGLWRGKGVFPGSVYSTDFVNTMSIDKVLQNRFMGKKSSEVRDGKGTRQDIAFTGILENGVLKFNYGNILYTKEPPSALWRWTDCRACRSTSLIQIAGDTILLTLTNFDCGQYCDGETKYFKLLSDFDSLTQKNIVGLFGDRDTVEKLIVKDSSDNELGRKTTVIATYKVFSPEIKIMLFDNGEIDNDIVSVYHNGEKIIDRKTLGIDPIVYTISASAKNRMHEFVLVAENLGDIPPNTAFMRIVSGEDQFELFAKTNLEENATIKVEYAGK